jgi:hypothetical protein
MTKKRSQDFLDGQMTWKLLESVLKHYLEFRELFEREGIDEITLDNGYILNFHDILQGINSLPKRQKQAVLLVCLYNMREVDAAREMGFDRWSSQVGTYKRLGLQKLINKFWPPEGDEGSEDSVK